MPAEHRCNHLLKSASKGKKNIFLNFFPEIFKSKNNKLLKFIYTIAITFCGDKFKTQLSNCLRVNENKK